MLGEDESLDTVPEEYHVVIDPDGEADEGGTGVTSWNDLKDKPFGDFNDTLVWDGNTEGLTCVQIDEAIQLYKVSDVVPTYDDCTAGGKSGFVLSGEEEFKKEDIIVDTSGMFMAGNAIIVPTEAVGVPIPVDDETTVTFAEAGTYFYYIPTGDVVLPAFFTYSLTINGYTGFPEITKKLDGDYVNLRTRVLYGKFKEAPAYIYADEGYTTKVTAVQLNEIVFSGVQLLFLCNGSYYVPWNYSFNQNDGSAELLCSGFDGFHTAEYTETTTTEDT